LVALDLSSATQKIINFLPKIANWGKIHFHMDPNERAIYEEQVLKVSFSPNLDYAGAIVIGSHGRTGIRKVILGSVAEGAISRSLLPVLTINIAYPRI